MNRKVILGVTCFVIVVVLVILLSRKKETFNFDLNLNLLRGCKVLNDKHSCNTGYFMYDFETPDDLVGRVSGIKVTLCCDSYESLNNARHELELKQINSNIKLLNKLLPKNIQDGIKATEFTLTDHNLPDNRVTNDKVAATGKIMAESAVAMAIKESKPKPKSFFGFLGF
jgi:hypothetical protein